MDEPTPDLDGLLNGLPMAAFGSVSLQQIATENRSLLAQVGSFDPLRLAATFGGLLTVPALQSNCLRLETLVHLTLATADGERKPNEKVIQQLYAKFGEGIAGRLEDPAENVFVSSIGTPRGNFRILGGIWESAGFYLQRVMGALERTPAGGTYDHIRAVVYALLRLSDLVCERAGLQANQLGSESTADRLASRTTSSLGSLRRAVRFTETELSGHGILANDLAAFCLRPSRRSSLIGEAMGHSELERRPLAVRNGEVFFLLPTAASAAIRRYVIEAMKDRGLRDLFAQTLAIEYADLFARTPLLGSHLGAPVKFGRVEGGLITAAIASVDTGRYLNLIFFSDTLEKFEDMGLVGEMPNADKLGDQITAWDTEAFARASKDPEFRGGVTLLVGCGMGRAARVPCGESREIWRFEVVSAPDLLTLSWIPDFSPLSLWRLFESEDKLQQLGVSLENMNGLLNMVAWARSLDGHLIPHAKMPEDFGRGGAPTFVVIEQNALRRVRHDSAVLWNAHVCNNVFGEWISVRRDGEELFEEDRLKPFYVSEERNEAGWPLSVFESRERPWWCVLDTHENTPGHWAYERSMMIKTWICRAAPVLDTAFPRLARGPVRVRFKFVGRLGDRHGGERPELLKYDIARASVVASVETSEATISLDVGQKFEDAIFHPENIAERALVAGLVEGVSMLARHPISLDEQDLLTRAIVPNASARQSHAFVARSVREYVRDSLPAKPVMLDDEDAAIFKLGLGWRVRDRASGGAIEGKSECTTFLNDLVKALENELCTELRDYDREEIIQFALANHESAIADRDNWARTSAAVLALHNDREATLQTMAEHDAKLNAVFQAARLLVEFAICESPIEGGRKPGRLDLSRLMIRVMMIVSFGGWSDAIYWDAMQPTLRVRPLGDVHANLSFREEIIARFGRAGHDVRVEENVSSYAKNLREAEIRSGESDVDPAFWEALEEELGASKTVVRNFLDFLDHIALEENRAVLRVPKSRLLSADFGGQPIDPIAAAALVEKLTLTSRPHWRDVPEGYTEKDRQPWRFRRRLSMLRRPFVQIDDKDDPAIVFAPGLVRDAMHYMMNQFFRGDFPLNQLKPKMKRWAGTSRDRIGKEFTQGVAERLTELKWKTETEVRVTKLLRKGFDRDYGDVDVLAWQPSSSRVLAIECKDVQYRKTDGEIAEQLADFRGEIRSDGKPDLLLRHLNRIELIGTHLSEVKKYTALTCSPRIEGHLVFRNPVPMQFAWERMKRRIALHLFSELGDL